MRAWWCLVPGVWCLVTGDWWRRGRIEPREAEGLRREGGNMGRLGLMGGDPEASPKMRAPMKRAPRCEATGNENAEAP